MATLPSFILKRLYVNESLSNTLDGFEFAVRNLIETGTILELFGLDVDGTAHPPNAVVLLMTDGGAKPGNMVTADAPLTLAAGSTPEEGTGVKADSTRTTGLPGGRAVTIPSRKRWRGAVPFS